MPKKAYEDKGRVTAVDEGPLDDPVAEKLRQQKCAALTLTPARWGVHAGLHASPHVMGRTHAHQSLVSVLQSYKAVLLQ